MGLPGDVAFGVGRASARWVGGPARAGWAVGAASGTATAPMPLAARAAASASTGTRILRREMPHGTIDGSNAVFTTTRPYSPGSTVLFLNGLAQSDPDDYSEVLPQGLRFVSPPEPGDHLLVFYAVA